MADFTADIRDVKFILFDQLGIDKLAEHEKYADFAREDMEMMLDEAYKFAREEMAPVNASMDREGCTFEDGKVTVPKDLHPLYELYNELGWASLSSSPEYGGQGAPESLMIGCCDFFFGANVSFNLGALLTMGAAHLVESFGTQEQKDVYLENMFSGQWAGTMCLTEPQAGSDVGASTTRAKKEGDHYLIEGEKIFITFGDQDITENIAHAVLARIEGAPKGTSGISLFLVPKFRVNDDGSVGEFNDVVCSGIEHKLGIHATPTCSLVFGSNGGCQGYLLGEEGGGMKAMFQMMNEARISVGVQGSSMAGAAYQGALNYTKERLQGPDIRNFKDPDAPRVPIINHPDVRMMLMKCKAYVEGMRALVLFTAYCEDMTHVTEGMERDKWDGFVQILTPICKAYCTDTGFRVSEIALQCYGGYGYCSEYPAEQNLRDSKIASIYEGTNGIQAMDLVGRKLGMNRGMNLMTLAGMITQNIDAHKEHPVLKDVSTAMAKARDVWGAVNMYFINSAQQKLLMVPLVNASNYLSMSGDLLMGHFLLAQAGIACDKLAALCEEAGVDPADAKAVRALAKENPDAAYLDGKIKTAQYFAAYELPLVAAKGSGIQAGDMSAMYTIFEGEGQD